MSIDSTVARRMTMAHEESSENKFVASVLPWLIAAAAAVVYLFTLNHWVSLSSLLPVARISGWVWQPSLTDPLYWVLTYPLHWLPLAAVPFCLNLFSAVCAALTLALLARSIALLPHDRTKEQRIREGSRFFTLSAPTAWVPPVVAAAICGLQITFWENATAASMEMLNLLLFAYVIRCLLEFRIGGRESWLLRAALVYGAGMANNWAMIGFFPLFVVALIWIKGMSFIEGPFLGRMFVMGVAGLTLYLVLPAISALSSGSEVGFWPALRTNLTTEKTYVMTLVFNKNNLLNGDRPLWVLGLPSLLPLLAVSIRWPSFMGDISKIGLALANVAFHVVHGVLLVVCLWVALDPQFSPRHYQPALGNYGILMLTFYYLGALSVGYFLGYFLLIFGVTPSGRQRYRKTYPPFINGTVMVVTLALAIIVPVVQLCRNLPQIRLTNGPQLRNYASLVADQLPSTGSMVMSDDPRRLLLLQSALTQSGKAKEHVLLDSGSLEWPAYYKYLKRQYPEHWQILPPKEVKKIASADLQRIVYRMAETNSLFYLHPSFGYYFEVLYPAPQGLVYRLQSYPTNAILAPWPSAEEISSNQDFWAKADERVLRQVAGAMAPAAAIEANGILDRLAQRAHLAIETNHDAQILGSFYSEALNFWGVQLQRQGQLPQAAAHFTRAIELNPDNVVAQVNLSCNQNLQAGKKTPVQISKDVEDKFGHRTWDQIMRENGPFDEPTFCFAQGNAFLQGGNSHQAALQFERVRVLEPDNLPALLSLAQIYFFNRLPEEALAVIKDIHAKGNLSINHTNAVQLLGIETAAQLAKGELKSAESAVDAALKKSPQDRDLLAIATKVYMDFGCYTNALKTTERQLQIDPDDAGALFYKGNACLQLNAYADAIEPLTRVLQMETNNFSKAHYLAQFMRAKAYLGMDKLNEAKSDYEVLRGALTNEFPVYFDLGEIAYRQKDTNGMVQNYELYKAHAPTNLTDDLKLVNSRLNDLKHGSP